MTKERPIFFATNKIILTTVTHRASFFPFFCIHEDRQFNSPGDSRNLVFSHDFGLLWISPGFLKDNPKNTHISDGFLKDRETALCKCI